jgi:hypothetical protein
VNIGIKASIKFMILSHFIKGKISLTPMETIFIIPRELEYLESLVKLARRRKYVENHNNQIVIIHQTPTIRRVSVNRMHQSKMLHLGVEINQALIEGLVDIRTSMSIMAINMVRELSIMHLVIGHETYKIAFGMVTQTLGIIIEFLVRVRGITC